MIDDRAAFIVVLDRAIDAEKQAAAARHEIAEIRKRIPDLERSAAAHDALKASADRDSKKLFELWTAADELLRAMSSSKQNDKVSDAQRRLRKALTESSDACDQIPF